MPSYWIGQPFTVCQPPMMSNSALLEESRTAESYSGDSHPSVDNSELVSSHSASVHGLSSPAAPNTRPASSDSQCRHSQPESSNPVGRLAYIGKSLQDKGLSAEAEDLVLSAWRDSTNRNYNSAWAKWETWCLHEHVNPISASIETVASFLAAQFRSGHQYRSLNSYRSAISSVHPKIDGFDVGKHPLICRLMKGAFNRRPPIPKYTMTWSVSTVLRYLRSLGPNTNLSLKDLSHKLATLLALTTASRSADLLLLSVNHSSRTSEGTKFVLSGPAKQSRLGHMHPPLVVQSFTEDALLCPMECLEAYVSMTQQFRCTDEQGLHQPSQLFLGISKPHAPVKACSIARWVKATLSSAGIDTSVFSAHSTRGASTSKAIESGATLTDVIQQADWSTAQTFFKFYFRPSSTRTFTRAVLSTSKLHADIEPSHSEV